jgi:hypothetical protein
MLVGCTSANEPIDETATASTANGVDCDVAYDALHAEGLAGIDVLEPTSSAIAAKEKIRHLNELSVTPAAYRDVLRTKHIPIKLTGGGVTAFPELAHLSGTVPRGWEGKGHTWDDVPGTGIPSGIYLGDSAKVNNAWSLAIHEGTHAVDLSLQLSERSTKLRAIYTRELQRTPVTGDQNVNYRRYHIQEYLAVAVDEYYCSAAKRAFLEQHYPEVFAYIRDDLDGELRTPP